MSTGDEMCDIERLVELQTIYRLKGRRDPAVDQKDWDTYAQLRTDDYVAMQSSAPSEARSDRLMSACSAQL